MSKHEIVIEVDNSCQMARVSCKGLQGMEGNFWDFHPGCHGIDKYGDFKGYEGLASNIKLWLIERKKVNPEDIIIKREKYVYE